MLSELERAQEKLGKARSKFKLNTRQGYIEAAEIANSLEISEFIRLMDQRYKEVSEFNKEIGFGVLSGIGYAIVGFILGLLVIGSIGCFISVANYQGFDRAGDAFKAAGITGGVIGSIIGFILGLVKGARKD